MTARIADRGFPGASATHSRAIVTQSASRCREAEAFRFVKVSRVKPKGVSVLSIAAVLEAGRRRH